MNEIYWLTRLDDVKLLIGFIIGFAVVVLVFGIGAMMFNDDQHNDDEKHMYNTGKKITIISSIILFVFSIGTCFIPNTNEAYMIYGLGGTIDYIKSNEVAKQLPDKCIIALDKYLEEANKE
jgi:glucose uptake protein GlcU